MEETDRGCIRRSTGSWSIGVMESWQHHAFNRITPTLHYSTTPFPFGVEATADRHPAFNRTW